MPFDFNNFDCDPSAVLVRFLESGLLRQSQADAFASVVAYLT